MSLNLRTFGLFSVAAIAALAACSGLAGAPPPAQLGITEPLGRNLPPPAKTVAWENFGFDTGQSGFNSLEKTLSRGNVGSLSELWAAPAYGVSLGGIVEANGAIYATDYTPQNGPGLQAFNEQTGSVLWTTAIPNQTSYDLAVGDGFVFAYANADQSVCAYKTKDGKNAWCANFPSSKYRVAAPESITYANGIVYVPLLGGPYVADALVALNAKSGAQLWSTNTDDGGCCSLSNTTRPIVSHGQVYDECDVVEGTGSKAFTDWGICAYGASSGSMLWMYIPVQKAVFSFYLAADKSGNLYLSLLYANNTGGTDMLLQGISGSGSQRWSNSYKVVHSEQSEFELATDDKTLYAQMDSNGGSGDVNSSIYAFNSQNGKQLWEINEPNGSTFLDAPVLANGVIYSLDRSSGMMAFRASNGKTLWNSELGASSGCYGGCSAQPIVVNGRVDSPCGGFGNSHLCAFGLPTNKKKSG